VESVAEIYAGAPTSKSSHHKRRSGKREARSIDPLIGPVGFVHQWFEAGIRYFPFRQCLVPMLKVPASNPAR